MEAKYQRNPFTKDPEIIIQQTNNGTLFRTLAEQHFTTAEYIRDPQTRIVTGVKITFNKRLNNFTEETS